LVFDVAVHAGTLSAVLIYYRSTLKELLLAVTRRNDAVASGSALREIGCLGIATLPVMLVGFFFMDFIDTHLRGLTTIAWATLGFGILLGVAYRFRGSDGDEQSITRVDHALIIGLAQAFAVIPGTSRSGITITAASFLGYNIATSARFSFLLSIPVIGGALLLMLVTQTNALDAGLIFETAAAMAIAGMSAYMTIAFFVGLVTRVGMMPFVVYRVLLAMALLLVASAT
jgi:undecaprenyl-diphosphatase